MIVITSSSIKSDYILESVNELASLGISKLDLSGGTLHQGSPKKHLHGNLHDTFTDLHGTGVFDHVLNWGIQSDEKNINSIAISIAISIVLAKRIKHVLLAETSSKFPLKLVIIAETSSTFSKTAPLN